MKVSNINFTVHLDDKHVPEKIFWDATDKPDPSLSEAKAVSIAVWDHKQKNTLRIDLWAKDMPVIEMKRFYIDCLGGFAQGILNATGDQVMAEETFALCRTLVKHLEKEVSGQ